MNRNKNKKTVNLLEISLIAWYNLFIMHKKHLRSEVIMKFFKNTNRFDSKEEIDKRLKLAREILDGWEFIKTKYTNLARTQGEPFYSVFDDLMQSGNASAPSIIDRLRNLDQAFRTLQNKNTHSTLMAFVEIAIDLQTAFATLSRLGVLAQKDFEAKFQKAKIILPPPPTVDTGRASFANKARFESSTPKTQTVKNSKVNQDYVNYISIAKTFLNGVNKDPKLKTLTETVVKTHKKLK